MARKARQTRRHRSSCGPVSPQTMLQRSARCLLDEMDRRARDGNSGSAEISVEAKPFLNELRQWLILTKDPRCHDLGLDWGLVVVELVPACIDFIKFLEGVCDRGGDENRWREYLNPV